MTLDEGPPRSPLVSHAPAGYDRGRDAKAASGEATSVFRPDEPANADGPVGRQSVWTPMRLKLCAWFRSDAAALTPAYEGAVEILGNARFPGRIHFISHAVRDIANALPFCFDPQLGGALVQYAHHLDGIEKEWKSRQQVSQQAAASDDGFIVSAKVAGLIDKLVEEHRESRKRPGKYELLFRALARKAPLTVSLDARAVEAFKRTAKWFVEHAHFRQHLPPPVDEQTLVWRFEEFERAIYVLVESLSEGGFFVGIGELDDILQQANR